MRNEEKRMRAILIAIKKPTLEEEINKNVEMKALIESEDETSRRNGSVSYTMQCT
jgi:hypothetical protein